MCKQWLNLKSNLRSNFQKCYLFLFFSFFGETQKCCFSFTTTCKNVIIHNLPRLKLVQTRMGKACQLQRVLNLFYVEKWKPFDDSVNKPWINPMILLECIKLCIKWNKLNFIYTYRIFFLVAILDVSHFSLEASIISSSRMKVREGKEKVHRQAKTSKLVWPCDFSKKLDNFSERVLTFDCVTRAELGFLVWRGWD